MEFIQERIEDGMRVVLVKHNNLYIVGACPENDTTYRDVLVCNCDIFYSIYDARNYFFSSGASPK